MNATELAQDVFGLWGTLELEPTAAQLGSVRRAIRHLTAEAAGSTGSFQNPKSEKAGGGAAATRKGSPRKTTLPLPTSS